MAREVGISPSYLNLIERNKRDVGGAVLLRIAAALGLDIGELTGEAEHRLVADVAEAFADPVLAPLGFDGEATRDLVAGNPALAAALTRLHRAYAESRNERDAYADRLRTDPLLREMLHQVLSGITAVRSGAEILADVPDIGEDDRRRFVNSIGSEARMLTGVARNLLGHFESEAAVRRAGSPARELDDLIFENDNYFAGLEAVAANLRREIEAFGPFGEAALVQRCQVHKMRNVLEYLSDRDRPWAQAILRRAYQAADVKTAQRLLRDLARRLETEYPSAAESVLSAIT